MFSTATFTFLAELAANNNREWFEANKPRYESLVREPAQKFISAMGPHLSEFAPRFVADPRKLGGSLMRVFRDTRFSRHKTPYKTNIGIQFRHSLGKDVHAPGFYLHIANDECFFGAGCWHPAPEALGKIRDHIVAQPKQWHALSKNKRMLANWAFAGESLSRPPRGYAADHPAIDDLKRKDFILLAPLDPAAVTDTGLVKLAASQFASATPFMSFLCAAVGAQY